MDLPKVGLPKADLPKADPPRAMASTTKNASAVNNAANPKAGTGAGPAICVSAECPDMAYTMATAAAV